MFPICFVFMGSLKDLVAAYAEYLITHIHDWL